MVLNKGVWCGGLHCVKMGAGLVVLNKGVWCRGLHNV